jgi:hypothetical protein
VSPPIEDTCHPSTLAACQLLVHSCLTNVVGDVIRTLGEFRGFNEWYNIGTSNTNRRKSTVEGPRPCGDILGVREFGHSVE